MKSKDNAGSLVALTLFLSFGLLVLWEFWLENLILVNYLEIKVNKNALDRWTFIVSCLSIVCISLILPLKSMKKTSDENKSLRTALHGEQALSNVFFSVDNSIILIINNSNKIMQINKKTSFILGYKEDEMLGQDWINFLVQKKGRDELKTRYQQFVKDKHQNFTRFTATAIAKDGSEKLIDWQCSPLRDENGNVYGSINSGQDISEPIRLRGELTHLKGKYEPYIKKLTTELNFNKKKYHSEAIKSANARARFRFWFELENTLMGLSSEQLKNSQDINNRITEALKLFSEISDAEHGYIFKFTQSGSHMINTHLWVAGEPMLEPDHEEEVFLDSFPWFKKNIQNKEIIQVTNIEEMPEEASAEKEMYRSQGIKSLINVPIIHNDSAVGYIGFESNQNEKKWDNDEISIIQVMARLVASITSLSTPEEPELEAEISPAFGDLPEALEEVDLAQLALETSPEISEFSEVSPQPPAPTIDKELRKVRESFERDFQDKIKSMERAQAQLAAELEERKRAEADLRSDRDSIANQLKEKSLELEKLIGGAGEDKPDKSAMKTNLKKSSVEGLPNTALTSQDKELAEMQHALQKKEAELNSLRSQLKSQTGGLTAAEIKEFKEKIAGKDDEIKSLRKSFDEERSTKTQLERDLTKIQESLTKSEKDIEVLETANQVMGAELEEFRKVQEEHFTHSIQLEDAQQELESLGMANEQLMSDIKEKSHIIDEAMERVAHYEQMDLPLFTLDQEGTLLTWNQTAESLTGYFSEIALNQSLSFMFADRDLFDFENEILAPLKETSRLRLEIPIKKENGEVFDGLVSLSSFKDRNGIITTLGYLTNLSDINNEEEVASIKRRLTTLLGDSGLLMMTLTPDYLISDMNQKVEATFPWNREDILEKNFFEIVLSQDNWQDVFSDIEGRMNTQAAADFETEALLEDQARYSFLWSLVKEIDPADETVKGYLALGQDITDLRKTQQKLRENEFLLNSIVDKAQDGVISIDENGIIQSFNDGAEKLFGYASRDIIGHNVSRLMPDPYSKEHDNYIRRYVDTGSSSLIGGPSREFIARNKNGSTFPVEIILKEIYKDYQRLFVGIVRDIRKRKETEIKLAESQEKYLRFMDAESDAVLVVDGGTQEILECNPAALHLYGYEREEFMRMSFKDLIGQPSSSSGTNNPFHISELGSTHRIPKIQSIKKDGTSFPGSITTNSFLFRDRQYEVKIIRDNSTEALLEEQLKESQVQFETLLKQSKMQQAALREEKLNLADHITSSVVDLVNNPIQGIESILDQVKEQAEMADIHKGLVTVAMNECRRVAGLIGRLKSFQPPNEDNVESLDVHQVLDEIIQDNQKTIEDRTITLEKNYARDVPVIDGITPQIRQAIDNIVKNAEESLSEDEGKIVISTEQDGTCVKIHIHDTGCGISEADIHRIFDPFFTTKTALHRPGLGLLESLGIVKNHRGEIDVRSRPGEGTTFTVTLPFKQALNQNGGS